MPITMFDGIKFDPELFMEYMEEMSPNPSAFIASGIIRHDPAIQNQITTQGNLVSVPFFKPLGGSSQNYDGSDIETNDIKSGKQSAIVIGRTNSWGSQDLAAELASKDPMKSIAVKVNTYWKEERQRTLIQLLNGVFNATSMNTHMHNVAIEDGNNAKEANLMGPDAMIDAIQKALGDNGTKIKAISVHSRVFYNMVKQNLIEYEPFGDQNLMLPYFLGKNVIVDDAHTVEASGTSGFKYTNYLFAGSSIGTGEGKVKVPAETGREQRQKGGYEFIVNRQRFVYHPYGIHFTGKNLETISPTDAELATGTNWEKAYEDKNIPIIKVVTNG